MPQQNRRRKPAYKTSEQEVQITKVTPNPEEQIQSSIIMGDVADVDRERAPKLNIAGYIIDRDPDYVIIDQYGRYHRAQPTVKSKWE